MATFERKYEPDQVEAVLHAYIDRKIRPWRKVAELAEQGRLLTRDGRECRPFKPNEGTFRGYIATEKRRRVGKAKRIAIDRPDDVLEHMRTRMIAVAEQELRHWEKKKTGNRDPEQLRQIVRLMREIKALPAPGDGRSRAPGQRDETGRKPDGASEGLAGKLLAAHRRTAPEPLTQTDTQAESSNAAHNARSDDTDTEPPEPSQPPHESGSLNSEAGRDAAQRITRAMVTAGAAQQD